MRRELSSALRDITALVSLPSMLQYMSRLAQQALAQYTSISGTLTSGHTAWVHLECVVYSANVVLGQARGQENLEANSVQALVEVAVACVHGQQGECYDLWVLLR